MRDMVEPSGAPGSRGEHVPVKTLSEDAPSAPTSIVAAKELTMTKVLILGANGGLARNTTRAFLEGSDATLTLYLRRASRLTNPDPKRVTIIDGDVLDPSKLRDAVNGQDAVYAKSAGASGRPI